jgi:hypothetical protein
LYNDKRRDLIKKAEIEELSKAPFIPKINTGTLVKPTGVVMPKSARNLPHISQKEYPDLLEIPVKDGYFYMIKN